MGATVSYANANLKTDYGTIDFAARSAGKLELAGAVKWTSKEKAINVGGTAEAVLLQLSAEGKTDKMSLVNGIFDVEIGGGGKLNIGAAGVTGYLQGGGQK